jgi:electron-transferring-flavoprotein dehydrogenase
MSGDGIIMAGDCAGFVDVASLKGIHYAMQAGIFAARTAFEALKAGDASAARLSGYDRLIRDSYIASDLRKTRNMRLAFKHGFVMAGIENGVMTATRGAFPGWKFAVEEDAAEPRVSKASEPFKPDNVLTFSKLDAVFKSGNATRDTIPSHLLVGRTSPPRWPTSTRTSARRGSTSVPPTAFGSIRPIASTARPPMCWGRAGLPGKAAAGRSTA